jgi:KDO2-lipid IV(A) lauroyltransferase
METPAVWLGDVERTDAWIHVVHDEAILVKHLNDSAGLLVLLPHMGNWELFNVFFRRYGQMTALYSPPRKGYMQKVMKKVRAGHGNNMVPTTPYGLKQLYKTLGDGGTAVILPDQVPTSGQFVPFFGHPALTDALASRLLKKTGAKTLGITLVRNDDGFFDAHVLVPDASIYDLDEAISMKALNDLMETCACIAPRQYQWEYKRFRERPAGSEKIYRFNKPSGYH